MGTSTLQLKMLSLTVLQNAAKAPKVNPAYLDRPVTRNMVSVVLAGDLNRIRKIRQITLDPGPGEGRRVKVVKVAMEGRVERSRD